MNHKISVFIAALFAVLFVFSSCSRSVTDGRADGDPVGTPAKDSEGDNASSIIVDEPPANAAFYYESYDDINNAFLNRESDGYMKLEECITSRDCGRYFNAFVNACREGNAKVPSPVVNGKEVELLDEEYHQIVLFTSEKFNLPWIWYYCESDGAEFTVELCPLGTLIPEAAQAESYAKASKLLAPQYPTADTDPAEYAETFKTISEKDVILANGDTVRATVFVYRESVFPNRECWRFLTDGTIVSVWNINGEMKFDDEFWAGFGIG